MSQARNVADLLASGTVLAASKLPTITADKLDDNAIHGQRNLVINGNMEVAQRGTSHTTAGYGSLDRFQLALSGGTATMSQESFTVGQTDVPGSEKYLRCNVSVGNNNAGVYHMIEAQNVLPAIGGKVTLSYYAKGTSPTDGLNVKVAWYDGSAGADATASVVTLTSSWVKYTHTFTIPSITGLNLASSNANARLEISWLQKNTDTGTAAFDLNLAQVQLEFGEQATPFEHRSYADELRRCQRYYFNRSASKWLFDLANSNYYRRGTEFYPVTMRAAPSITVTYSGTPGNSRGVQHISDHHCNTYVDNESSYAYYTNIVGDAEL